MIVQSLRHAAWPAVLACATVVACSKKAATEEAFVNASLGGTSTCPVANAPVVTAGSMTSGSEPMTIPDGEGSLTVTCSVAPSSGGYSIQLDAKTEGSSGGELTVTGTVDPNTGGTVTAQFVSQTAGIVYTSDSCTLTYTYLGLPIMKGENISSGSIFGHVSCPNAEQPSSSINGTQTTGPDGGIVNTVCDGEADFLFQNCTD